MNDQVLEHLHELKALEANPATKELDLERWCQSVVRNCLGFTPTNGYNIRAQETRGKMRPDLLVMKGDVIVCVIEVKKLGFDLSKSDFRSGKVQLAEYLNALGDVRWGILSNGYEWRLYDFSQRNAGGTEVTSFDLRNEEDQIDLTKRSIDDICWSFVDLHESMYAGNSWENLAKEATAFSPESLARAILSAESVKYIAKIIRGEHDYRANTEVLFDKLSTLLQNGLDDCAHGWNEVKQAELGKYVTSQKRAGRRRAAKEAKTSATPPPIKEGTSEATQEACTPPNPTAKQAA
ncbi:MAG: hypothetical protein A2070_07130 [Bdellovibrionales bacterium GWC1_52_8]|nr:MAG: hypothetical protein A2X97_00490 [Bdellovibrionales bacterium GWA1_52_35]OFZ37250.1 MAG: hypothetical protein A2070_07130 [Bdellovibrionales bacterium GWC1_52_8]